MSLFSDLYNTLAKFFHNQEEEQADASKSVATNRLKLVLMQDRTNLTPRILEQMRSELIELLSRYVELDKELLDLNFEQEGNQVALMLSIPVIRAKDEEEIDAALKERDEMLKLVEDAKSSKECSEDEKVPDVLEDSENSETNEVSEETSSDEKEENADSRTEEEKVEADKTDTIANVLQDIPKIIKKKEKKEVSAPEEMTNSGSNPFKSDNAEIESMAESSSEN